MNITVQIRDLNQNGPALAHATVELDGCFVIRDMRIVEGKNGLFLGMPAWKTEDGYMDVCFPRTKEFREQLTEAVLTAYRAAAEKEAPESGLEAE